MRAEVPPKATNVEESRRNPNVASAVVFAVAFAVVIAAVTVRPPAVVTLNRTLTTSVFSLEH
jgi:hypothetical protein